MDTCNAECVCVLVIHFLFIWLHTQFIHFGRLILVVPNEPLINQRFRNWAASPLVRITDCGWELHLNFFFFDNHGIGCFVVFLVLDSIREKDHFYGSYWLIFKFPIVHIGGQENENTQRLGKNEKQTVVTGTYIRNYLKLLLGTKKFTTRIFKEHFSFIFLFD